MKILSFNCQKGFQPGLGGFLNRIFESKTYDFLLLQEVNGIVLSMSQNIPGYKLLDAFNEEAGEQSHLCILYRDHFEFQNSLFRSFSRMNRAFYARPELGFLAGTFSCAGKSVVVGSAHLHPALSFQLRAKEVRIIKEKLLTHSDSQVIFGGDFNFGLPWEISNASKSLSPEFIDVTRDIGPTLNSRYTEVGNHISSRTGSILAKFGIEVLLSTDHVYVDQRTFESSRITVKKLSDRVSDHSPIELILTPLS